MSPGADVQAIEALQDWHNALCVFRTEATESLGSIALEIQRAFDWIDDQSRGWKREVRDAEDEVLRAKSELAQRSTPDYSGRVPDTSVQEENLARAKARLRFAEEQIEVCRKWSIRLPKMVSEEYEGTARKFSNFLEIDLVSAIAQLNTRIDRLHAYTAVQPSSSGPQAKPNAEAGT
jgi:hypothetical protein